MRIALEIYFGIMLFWLGYNTRDETDFNDWKNYPKVLVSPIFCVLWVILKLIDSSWYWLSSTFQLKFFWRHYILSREYEKVTIDSWNMTLKAKTKNTLSHKVWRLCVRLANERYNKTNNGKDI